MDKGIAERIVGPFLIVLLTTLTPDASAQNTDGSLVMSEDILMKRDLDASTQFRLGPGDVISVLVWKQPSVSQTVMINPDGRISYPLVGQIQASGRTLSELESAIATRLGKQLRDLQVTAVLKDVRSYRVFVMGEVLRPGVFELDGGVTIVQAIAMAGGFTAFASKKNVIVYNLTARGGRRYNFDYSSFVANDAGVEDIVLVPGDTVIVK